MLPRRRGYEVERTWRAVRVVFGERQPRLEVATVVQRVGIQDDESDAPFKEVVVD